MEDKRRFVQDVIAAYIRHGDGRYDWLMNNVCIEYLDESDGLPKCEEVIEVTNGHWTKRYCVTGDSLNAINEVIHDIIA